MNWGFRHFRTVDEDLLGDALTIRAFRNRPHHQPTIHQNTPTTIKRLSPKRPAHPYPQFTKTAPKRPRQHINPTPAPKHQLHTLLTLSHPVQPPRGTHTNSTRAMAVETVREREKVTSVARLTSALQSTSTCSTSTWPFSLAM
jgi:hypothetical protein